MGAILIACFLFTLPNSGPPLEGRFVHWWTRPEITDKLDLPHDKLAQLAKTLNDSQIRYDILLTRIRGVRRQLQARYNDPAINSDQITGLYDQELAGPLAEMDRLRMQARVAARDALGPKGLEAANSHFPHLFTGLWFTRPKTPVVEVKVNP